MDAYRVATPEIAAPFRAISDPEERALAFLVDLYGRFRRDGRPEPPALADDPDEETAPIRALAERRAMRDLLLMGWHVHPARRRMLRAALEHAVTYEAWRSLAWPHGLSDEHCAKLMLSMVRAAAGRDLARR